MTQIEVTDGDIAEAKSLIDSFDGPDEAVQGIAQTLAKLRVAREALDRSEKAIAEYYRYWTGGETRGSYDGKPERRGLWAARAHTRQALAQIAQETPE